MKGIENGNDMVAWRHQRQRSEGSGNEGDNACGGDIRKMWQ